MNPGYPVVIEKVMLPTHLLATLSLNLINLMKNKVLLGEVC